MQELLESVTAEDYDKIKTYLRHTDGTELSDEEISNFVLNTGLYRAILVGFIIEIAGDTLT